MKKILLFFSLLISLISSAQYVEYKVPATANNVGMVVLRPATFDPAIKYRLIIFNPGVGARGDGSLAALDKIYLNDEGYTMTGLETAVKNDGRYILVTVQPKNLYELWETQKGRNWAVNEFKQYLDPSRIYLTGLSLGGGGCDKFFAYYPNSKMFAASVIVCPGGNSGFIYNGEQGFKNFGIDTTPKYIVHCIDDKTVTPAESTFPLIKKAREYNPKANVQAIIFKSGNHAAWKVYNQFPMANANDAFDSYTYENKTYPAVNDEKGSFIDFFELNSIGQPAKFLPRRSDPANIPAPAPPKDTIVIVPGDTTVVKPSDPVIIKPDSVKSTPTITAWNISINAVKKVYLTVYWSDGTVTTAADKTGNPITNFWLPVVPAGKERVSITYQDKSLQAIGPKK
jgi:hypothetical protein